MGDTVFASRPEATGSVNIDIGGEHCYASISQWKRRQNSDSEGRHWNTTIKAGFLINAGQLTFLRWNMRREWCSSRVIFEDLPDQVVPAIFLSSCFGYASVSFVNLCSSPPETCTQCDALCHVSQSNL